MSHKALEYFGSKLMKEVRDAAISQWEATLAGRMKDKKSKELYDRIKQAGLTDSPLLREMTEAVVDTCVHDLLWMFERSEEVVLSVNTGDAQCENLAEESDGLSGELYSEKGWIRRYSDYK